MKVRPFFRWFDLWVGAYWDRKARVLYVCPLPSIGAAIAFGESREQSVPIDVATEMPGTFTAYRRTDGEPVHGEYEWVSEGVELCDGGFHFDEPDEYEEVVMVPTWVRTFPCHEPELEDDDE